MNWRQKINRRLVVVRAPENPGDANTYYPELGLAVKRLSVERIATGDEALIVPEWLARTVTAPSEA